MNCLVTAFYDQVHHTPATCTLGDFDIVLPQRGEAGGQPWWYPRTPGNSFWNPEGIQAPRYPAVPPQLV